MHIRKTILHGILHLKIRFDLLSGAHRKWGYRLSFKSDPFQQRSAHLGGHSTPEIGVGRPGLQHGGYHCLILRNHQIEGVWVSQQVVSIYKLKEKMK